MEKTILPPHIQVLLDPATYPHPVDDISLIQTHISWVFLTGSFAYKIKKPVDFGFLDFTTLEKRRKACMDELELNRRLTPEIYLEVLPVYKRDDQYLLDCPNGDGAIVDYCLRMIQFDQDDLFDVRLEQGRFSSGWMDQLAESIARFHQKAETSPYIETFGEPKLLLDHIEESLHIAETHQQAGVDAKILEELRGKSRKQFDAIRKELTVRQQEHHIRNCHGDLHLKNIALIHGNPTPFDCIEFSDEFRMIDTMNDVAFLVMDCDARERPDLGYRFLSRYLEQTGDYEGLRPLPLYLSYRAGVRGKVSCLSADTPYLQPHETEALYQAARHYFTLAERYLAAGKPRLYIIGGLSGSGKSHLALRGAGHERAIIIRSDATRKRIAGNHSTLPLYGKEMHRLTYQAMFEAAEKALRASFSVILDATFLHPASRVEAVELAGRLQVPFTFYWLDMDEQLLRERVSQRTAENSDISDADLEVLKMQLKEYRRPQEAYVTFIRNSERWPPGTAETNR